MTQEKKKLLLKDLCARLPYGLMVLYNNELICQPSGLTKFDGQTCITAFGVIDPIEIEKVKLYLRPMSSMTEEEKELLRLEHEKDEHLFTECIEKSKLGDNSMRGKIITHFGSDWCNKYHFDYRGLIPMDLALEAPDDMYKTEL